MVIDSATLDPTRAYKLLIGSTIPRVRNRSAPLAFSYKHQGDLAVIGRESAVVALGKLHLSGFIAWIFWCLVHVLFLIGFRSKAVVAARVAVELRDATMQCAVDLRRPAET